MATYSVFGLALRSQLDFPELPVLAQDEQEREGGDVSLHLGAIGVDRPADVESASWLSARPDDMAIAWQNFGSVRIRGGDSIRLDAKPEVDPRWVRSVVLGQVFSVLLAQRGLFPLHSSSVVIGGEAVAFAGESGEGKSTLAGALVARGHGFLSDDVTALETRGDGLFARPGPPRQKLEREAASALGMAIEEMSPVHSQEEKRVASVATSSRSDEAPLRAIYVLESGDRDEIRPVPPHEAFREVMRNLHRVELMKAALGDEELMRRCAAIVNKVPLYYLTRRRGLDRLEETVRSIEEHGR